MSRIKADDSGWYVKPGRHIAFRKELSELLGVSRVPVREALKILQFIKVMKRAREALYSERPSVGKIIGSS